jgi:redox-sensitive bicupin YhaK (pirin superfamily)
MGNGRILGPGEIQLMGAGRGVRHSEYNPSPSEPVHILQIWIEPHTRGLEPRYTEWKPAPGPAAAKTLVISPDGRENSAVIFQDAEVFLLRPRDGETIRHEVTRGRGIWFHAASGKFTVNGVPLREGDAVSTEDAGELEITGENGAQALLFDLG